MKSTKEKYRIVEYQYKFHVEKLVKFLWWSYYDDIKQCNQENPQIFDTLEDAKKYIDGIKIRYHYI